MLTCALDFDAGADIHLCGSLCCYGRRCGSVSVRTVWEEEFVNDGLGYYATRRRKRMTGSNLIDHEGLARK